MARTLTRPEDPELAIRKQHTDFQREVIACRERWWRYATSRVGRSRADDLTQDTQLRVLRREGRLEIRSVRAYGFTTLRNLIRDEKRRAWPVIVPFDDGDGVFSCNGRERPELNALLDPLVGREREIVELRYVEELKTAEIAEALGMTRIAAQKALYRAMQKLRAYHEVRAERGLR